MGVSVQLKVGRRRMMRLRGKKKRERKILVIKLFISGWSEGDLWTVIMKEVTSTNKIVS